MPDEACLRGARGRIDSVLGDDHWGPENRQWCEDKKSKIQAELEFWAKSLGDNDCATYVTQTKPTLNDFGTTQKRQKPGHFLHTVRRVAWTPPPALSKGLAQTLNPFVGAYPCDDAPIPVATDFAKHGESLAVPGTDDLARDVFDYVMDLVAQRRPGSAGPPNRARPHRASRASMTSRNAATSTF